MRNITPLGRIQIVKSLALSKLTHLLISLPSPNTLTLQKLQKMFTNFIWRNKRHCVNKEVLQAPSNSGGLNMINVIDFDQGLKLSWLRKVIEGQEAWLGITDNMKINQLLYLGPKEIINIKNNCHIPFWKDFLQSGYQGTQSPNLRNSRGNKKGTIMG